MENEYVVCPGCGAQINSETNGLDKDFNASASCRQLLYQLSYYTLSLQDSYFFHQLVVDAYSAQHSGSRVKPISTTFALIGLYLVNERNCTGKQVQLTHMALAKKSKEYPHFVLPEVTDWLTVLDVIQVPDAKKPEMITKWSQSVWKVWKPEEDLIAALLKRYLRI